MKSRMLGALVLLVLVGPSAALQGGEPGQPVPVQAQQAGVPEQAADQQAAAGTPPVPQARPAGTNKADGEKVCKLTAVTGTRFRSKLCYTQAQWDAIDRAHREKMREIDSQPVRQETD